MSQKLSIQTCVWTQPLSLPSNLPTIDIWLFVVNPTLSSLNDYSTYSIDKWLDSGGQANLAENCLAQNRQKSWII